MDETLGKSFGISSTTFRLTYLPLLELPRDLQDALASLKFTTVLELAKVKSDIDRTALTQKAIINLWSVKDVKANIKKLDTEPSISGTTTAAQKHLASLEKAVALEADARDDETQREILALLENLNLLLA